MNLLTIESDKSKLVRNPCKNDSPIIPAKHKPMSHREDAPHFPTFSNFRMVNVERGCLLTVDPPTKQYLLHLDERKEFRGRKFILKGYF